MHRIKVSPTQAEAWTQVSLVNHLLHGILRAPRTAYLGLRNSKDKITRYKEEASTLATGKVIQMKIYSMFIGKTNTEIECDQQLTKANLKLRPMWRKPI